jgi:hypothetical protein
MQFDVLKSTQAIIVEKLDRMFIGDKEDIRVDASRLNEVCGFFWLWVLGAYEVLRAMAERASCFDEEAAKKITSQKERLATIRMPFAKQEFRGKGLPIDNENSVDGIDSEVRDISFLISGEEFYIKAFMQDVIDVLSSVSLDDVKCDFRDWVKPVKPIRTKDR